MKNEYKKSCHQYKNITSTQFNIVVKYFDEEFVKIFLDRWSVETKIY